VGHRGGRPRPHGAIGGFSNANFGPPSTSFNSSYNSNFNSALTHSAEGSCGDTPHTTSPPQNSPFTKNTHSRISKRLGDIPVWRSATPRHTPMTHSASDVLPRSSFARGLPLGAPRADLRLPPLALGSHRHPRSRLPRGQLGSPANRPITVLPLNNRGTASTASRTVNPGSINTAVPALQNHSSSILQRRFGPDVSTRSSPAPALREHLSASPLPYQE